LILWKKFIHLWYWLRVWKMNCFRIINLSTRNLVLYFSLLNFLLWKENYPQFSLFASINSEKTSKNLKEIFHLQNPLLSQTSTSSQNDNNKRTLQPLNISLLTFKFFSVLIEKNGRVKLIFFPASKKFIYWERQVLLFCPSFLLEKEIDILDNDLARLSNG